MPYGSHEYKRHTKCVKSDQKSNEVVKINDKYIRLSLLYIQYSYIASYDYVSILE